MLDRIVVTTWTELEDMEKNKVGKHDKIENEKHTDKSVIANSIQLANQGAHEAKACCCSKTRLPGGPRGLIRLAPKIDIVPVMARVGGGPKNIKARHVESLTACSTRPMSIGCNN